MDETGGKGEGGGKPVASGFSGVLLALLAGLFASVTLATIVGPVWISPLTVWKVALHEATGFLRPDWSAAEGQIVWQIRFPRVLLAAVVGAGLSVVGTALQAAVRNPLADPFVLGGSSGASVGAVLVIVGGVQFFGIYSLSVAAFVGASVAFVLVLALARSPGGHTSPLRLILAGVAASYALSAVTSFLVLRADDPEEVRSVLFWTLGSLGGARWEYLTLPSAALIGGTALLLAQSRSLNALLAGEETAVTLGVETDGFRRRLLILCGLLTGTMVAVSGTIGFVGLMVPHTVRLVVGADHRRVLPAAALSGAILLVWADVVARTAISPEEMPVGVVTSLAGAPFFLWLMRRKRGAFGGEGG
ncbi:MAG: iron ABC transporter permease [Rubrobacter sp.]|nr:iron ABC transporter permease [Rubrobacter sp.]MDQ3378013.1 iron ABC transporter permease [Actinomycetota bacterium]